MYNDTITLFCRREDKRKSITWYPHILSGINLNIDAAAIAAKYGAESQDNVALNIRYTPSPDGKFIGKCRWLPPKEWRRLTDVSGTLTFSGGNDFDFFMAGEWIDEQPVYDAEFGMDGFYDYMNATYDYVYAVTSVAEYSIIPHFEILAK